MTPAIKDTTSHNSASLGQVDTGIHTRFAEIESLLEQIRDETKERQKSSKACGDDVEVADFELENLRRGFHCGAR